MQQHLDTFARFKERPQFEELDSLTVAYSQLEPFERAQLLTLCPGDHEEAKALIPSLANKISNDDLDQLLGDIAGVKMH